MMHPVLLLYVMFTFSIFLLRITMDTECFVAPGFEKVLDIFKLVLYN